MNSTLTTLRAALEALCRIRFAPMSTYHHHEKAITDLRTLIASMEAQPEKQPFAWAIHYKDSAENHGVVLDTDRELAIARCEDCMGNSVESYSTPIALYTHAQPSDDLSFKADYWKRMHDECRAELITMKSAQPSEPKAEPTRSQKLRDAGHERRPKGWDKDGDEIAQPSEPKAEPARLTAAEIDEIWVEHGLDECDPHGFARAIESKIRGDV